LIAGMITQFRGEPMDNDHATSPFDVNQRMWQMWWDFVSRSMSAGLSFAPGSTPPEAAKSVRSGLLQTWADGWQQFMRSPEFLDGIRTSLEASLQARQQWTDLLGQMQHEMQGVSRQDFDQLMRTLRRFDERMSEGMGQLAAGLMDLSSRMQKLEEVLARQANQVHT
jgi:hypothetical protein